MGPQEVSFIERLFYYVLYSEGPLSEVPLYMIHVIIIIPTVQYTCIISHYKHSSPAEKAFEVASGGGPGDNDGELRSVGEGNSIFVAALKEHLQNTDNAIYDSVQDLFSATSKGL